MGPTISFARSTRLDKWKRPQLLAMCLGGNENARKFFKAKGWTNLHERIEEKYVSRAARLYRATLEQKVAQARRQGLSPMAAAGGAAAGTAGPTSPGDAPTAGLISGLDALALDAERQSGSPAARPADDSPRGLDRTPSSSPTPLASNFVDLRQARATLQAEEAARAQEEEVHRPVVVHHPRAEEADQGDDGAAPFTNASWAHAMALPQHHDPKEEDGEGGGGGGEVNGDAAPTGGASKGGAKALDELFGDDDDWDSWAREPAPAPTRAAGRAKPSPSQATPAPPASAPAPAMRTTTRLGRSEPPAAAAPVRPASGYNPAPRPAGRFGGALGMGVLSGAAATGAATAASGSRRMGGVGSKPEPPAAPKNDFFSREAGTGGGDTEWRGRLANARGLGSDTLWGAADGGGGGGGGRAGRRGGRRGGPEEDDFGEFVSTIGEQMADDIRNIGGRMRDGVRVLKDGFRDLMEG